MEGNAALALRGGTVIDVRTGEQTPDAVLIVEDGRIIQIGRLGHVVIPPGAHVEDTSDAWVIPGLVDMHVHLTFDPLNTQLLPLYLAHGVTTVRDVGGNLTTLILLRHDIAAGRCLAPRLFFAGPLLDGLPPLWPDHTLLVNSAACARSAVRMLIDQGVDCVKVYNNVPESSLAAIVEEAHGAHRLVIGHIPRTLSMSRAVEIGMDCLEHIRVTGREILPEHEADEIDPLPVGTRETLLWERFDVQSPGMDRLIGRLVDANVFLDPTLIIDAVMFTGKLEDERAVAVEEALPQETRTRLNRDSWIDNLSGPQELKQRAAEGFEKRLLFISQCNEAGVRMLAGTDTFGAGALLPGAGLLNELALLRCAGLSPLQVLQACTSTAASALGVEDSVGTLEVGKLADIVVLDADPLVDVRNTRNVRLVVKNGDVFTPSGLIEMAATNSMESQ